MLKRLPASPKRTNDPERTKRDIVEVATEEFASQGYSGARVDAIAAKCGFGSQETMRRAFSRRLRVSPSAYRERFQSPMRAVS